MHTDHQTTSVRCLWTSTDRSACHFRNLYYDTHTARFAFFSQSSELRTQPWQPPRYMVGNVTNPVSQEEVELVKVQPVEAEKREDGCDPRCTTRPGPRAYVALAHKLSSHSPLHFWESRANLNNTKLCCMCEVYACTSAWVDPSMPSTVSAWKEMECRRKCLRSRQRRCAHCTYTSRKSRGGSLYSTTWHSTNYDLQQGRSSLRVSEIRRTCCRTYEPLEFKDAGFQMDWVPEDPPSGSDVVEVAQNVIMRKPLRVRSFGHLLRDNIRAIAELAGYFGISVSSLQWIPHAPASNEESGPGLVRPRVLFVAVHQGQQHAECIRLHLPVDDSSALAIVTSQWGL